MTRELIYNIGFENIDARYSDKWNEPYNKWIKITKDTIPNRRIYLYITIDTSIPEFTLLCYKLEEWKLKMTAEDKPFQICLSFSEIPKNINFESSYTETWMFQFPRYNLNRNGLPVCLYGVYGFGSIRPHLMNVDWRDQAKLVINCLQECNVADVNLMNLDFNNNKPLHTEDPFTMSLLPEDINFEDVNNAVKLENFEKKYGKNMDFPYDLRFKIYSMCTPIISYTPNKINDMYNINPWNYEKNIYDGITSDL